MLRVNPWVNPLGTRMSGYGQSYPSRFTACNPPASRSGVTFAWGVGGDRFSARMPHPLRFGKIEDIAGPIPPNSLVILVPGMLSPASSMFALADYLKPRGHTVHILESPHNLKADSALASTDWLTHRLDRIRLDEASARYISLISQLEKLPHQERVDFLRKSLNLKHNEMGVATAKAVLGLMFTPSSNYEAPTDLTKLIQTLRKSRLDQGGTLPPETTHKQLYSLTMIARNELRNNLLPHFFRNVPESELKARDQALEKTIDHVMDEIAPRVVLVGHSMGGFVSMLTLFEQMRDTALVVGLSAPGENGTQLIPPALAALYNLPESLQQTGRKIADWLGPALRHMLEGSPETTKLKADHQPFNTTILAVGMPEDYDGLVGENNFKMNDRLPGRINVVVTPKQANMAALASSRWDSLHRLMRQVPPYSWLLSYLAIELYGPPIQLCQGRGLSLWAVAIREPVLEAGRRYPARHYGAPQEC